MRIIHFTSLLLLFIIFTTAINVAYSSEYQGECVYVVYVKTGDVEKAGTDSKISLSFSDYSGESVSVDNLKEWGIMGRGHNYFEKGNVDIFFGRTKCLSSSICKLSLSSNGKGILPAWFVESIEVTFTGFYKECSKTFFILNKWLSPEPHRELSFEVNTCNFPFSFLPERSSTYSKEGILLKKGMAARRAFVDELPRVPPMSYASA